MESDVDESCRCVFVSRESIRGKNRLSCRHCKSMKVKGKNFINLIGFKAYPSNHLRCDGLHAPESCPYGGVRLGKNR